jgi:hypothetical protein
LLALQLVADYWAFLYVAWVVPLMAMSLLGEPAPTRRHAVLTARRYRASQLPGPRALDRLRSAERA